MGSRQRRQRVVVLTEINSVDEFKLDAYPLHAESPETAEGWLLNARQQCMDDKTGEFLQFISPLSGKPLKIYKSDGKNSDNKKEDIDDNIAIIAALTEDKEMVFLDQGKNKDGRLLWLGIALSGIILILLIAVLMVLKHNNAKIITVPPPHVMEEIYVKTT